MSLLLPQHMPRDYQQDALTALWNTLGSTTGNPIVAMPTGTGKSHVIGHFLHEGFAQFPYLRAMMLTHVKELIGQNAIKMREIWPQVPMGIFSAGLNQKNGSLPITFAGIASVVKALDTIFANTWLDLIIIDECHLVGVNAESMYLRVIEHFRKINPYLRVIGFSATPFRMGLGYLTEGGIFDTFAIDQTGRDAFNWFINNGYLIRPVAQPTHARLDLSGVTMQGGDFNTASLAKAMDAQDKTHYDALAEAVSRSAGRRAWLVFVSGVGRAEWAAGILQSWGVNATFVHDKVVDRDARIRDYKAGHYQAMVVNNMLTVGFDYSWIDLIVMLRPTASVPLWVQMVGRGTRPDYDLDFVYNYGLDTWQMRVEAINRSLKHNCLVLDFAGNAPRLGPINEPRIPGKPGLGGGDMPVKTCEVCGSYNHISARTCEACGADFSFQTKITTTYGDADIVSNADLDLEWLNVTSTTYFLHNSAKNGIATLKVSYRCGYKSFVEYVCLEHSGWPHKQAKDWWRTRYLGRDQDYVPETVREALDHTRDLKEPTRIRVNTKQNAKLADIWSYEYE